MSKDNRALEGIVVGKGMSKKLVPKPEMAPPDGASETEWREWLEYMGEFLAAHSEGASFEVRAAWIEDEAQEIVEEYEGRESAAADHAHRAIEFLEFARVSRNDGNIDGAMRWALQAGFEHAMMWAVELRTEPARKARAAAPKNLAPQVERAERDKMWANADAALKERRPDMSQRRRADYIITQLDLDCDPRTVINAVKRHKKLEKD